MGTGQRKSRYHQVTGEFLQRHRRALGEELVYFTLLLYRTLLLLIRRLFSSDKIFYNVRFLGVYLQKVFFTGFVVPKNEIFYAALPIVVHSIV